MDTALLTEDRVAVRDVLSSYEQAGVRFHALRTRQAGARKFISLHVLVPGDWTVQRGHQLVELSKTTFAMSCWTRRCSHILNHWMIRSRGTTKPSIDGHISKLTALRGKQSEEPGHPHPGPLIFYPVNL